MGNSSGYLQEDRPEIPNVSCAMKNESGSPRIRAVSASMKPPLIRPEGFSQLGDGLQRSSVLRFTMSHSLSLSVVSRETNRDWNPKHGGHSPRRQRRRQRDGEEEEEEKHEAVRQSNERKRGLLFVRETGRRHFLNNE